MLQCNNFEVINMGVMAVRANSLQRSESRHRWSIGLITPSLEEMACGEGDGTRRFGDPLLIGGATTSRTYAVKIEPNYRQRTDDLGADTSRTVGVC